MQTLKFHAKLDIDPEQLADRVSPLRAGERIRVLHEELGEHLVATTSFGLQAAVMLHLIHENAPRVPVVVIDTGFLFPETYRYMDELMGRFEKLDLRVYQPQVSAARMQAMWGNLWEGDKAGQDQYALLTKIEPMNRALSDLGADVWLSGLRRSHSKSRQERSFVERQKKTLKAYPILDWADAQVDLYFHQHDLPRHPLQDRGYVTMGDWHSTVPAHGLEAVETRFNGEKYECGLHLESGASDFQI